MACAKFRHNYILLFLWEHRWQQSLIRSVENKLARAWVRHMSLQPWVELSRDRCRFEDVVHMKHEASDDETGK